MDNRIIIDTELLDKMIVGRVEPYIYAFSTETVPNYLKVGDTYRAVNVRLGEWKKVFPNLIKQYAHSAKIDDGTFFRDFAVHYFLETEKGRCRLQPKKFEDIPYYSNEFFEHATADDLDEAITDIHKSAKEQNGKYKLYTSDGLPQNLKYKREENYQPRDNQQEAIDCFKKAVANGRKNLLMYAVMRFGKSFTAMCCATECGADFVVVVSAKADVKEEWKKTVESHVRFEGYDFLDSDSLLADNNAVSSRLNEQKKVVLFLTLQDLQGVDIKNKHKEVFERIIDLLIIDETHFGVRAASYGRVLLEHRLTKSEINNELADVDGFDTIDSVEVAVKELSTKVRLHLSGTPYRILMSDEFGKEDIIAFCQFTDIIDAQKKWDEEHHSEDAYEEWDNPYYGFPQMIRFAFNPNTTSIARMKALNKEGVTCTLSALFRPQSIMKTKKGLHRQFIYKQEVLNLFEVIDGLKDDENLFGFLNYDKIKEGKMCRHMVCVLPFRASCDALAQLLNENKERFVNLCEYEIINIAGFDDEKKYKSTEIVKQHIRNCESENRKTITLTVNRMLTGTTVPEWDTMLFLKDTASPQEYDQAIFRLQNQYIKTYENEEGKTIKYNMKPQTLLVDFDLNRMFRLQELKAHFYNVNTDHQGNSKLKERIAKELEISPIIVFNRNKFQQVEPKNITDAVREYSSNRSVLDEALEIPADYTLLEDENIIKLIAEIEPIDAKNGLQIKPVEGEGEDIEIPNTGGGDTDVPPSQTEKKSNQQENKSGEDDKIEKRLAAYYARVLFFAFLTDSTVKSLEDVITQIQNNENNQRIRRHLGLDVNILKLIQSKSSPFILRDFDYKIENINDLVRDAELTPIERVEVAMRKFGRLSDSEIVTPAKVADEMVSILPFDKLNQKDEIRFLDIAAKQGEFSIAIYKKFGEKVRNSIYAIPTSKLTYEFTRKVYSLLGMPAENVFSDFTSYDLIKERKEELIKRLKDMNIDVIISNPPYQEGDGGGIASSKPLYNLFVEVSKDIKTAYISMIMPARWYTGGKGLDEFRENSLKDRHFTDIVDFPNPKECFPNTNISGGVCYFLYDTETESDCKFTNVVKGKRETSVRELNEYDIFIRYNNAVSIIRKVVEKTEKTFVDIVSTRNPFGLDSSHRGEAKQTSLSDIKMYSSGGVGYIKRSQIKDSSSLLKFYKVFMGKVLSGHIGETDDKGQVKVIATLQCAKPNEVCTDSYLVIGSFISEQESENASKYMCTKFLRFLLLQSLASMNISRMNFRFVPLQDFTPNSDIDWTKPISEIDTQLYAKYNLTNDEISFIESMIKPM